MNLTECFSDHLAFSLLEELNGNYDYCYKATCNDNKSCVSANKCKPEATYVYGIIYCNIYRYNDKSDIITVFVCSWIQGDCTPIADGKTDRTYHASVAPNCRLSEKLSPNETELCSLIVTALDLIETTSIFFTAVCTPSPLVPEISSTSVQAHGESDYDSYP